MNYLTLIPWFLFFIFYSYYIYLEISAQKTYNYRKWIDENFWKIFRFDTLFLIAIFIFFIRYKNNFVNLMLFFAINLYLLINILYELPKKEKFKIPLTTLISFLIILFIPLIIYFLTKSFVITTLVMFGYTFFAYIIVIVIKKWEISHKKR